jgi:hypothetical protein
MPIGYAADGTDMYTPSGWKRPDWWTDELDETHPLARVQITTQEQAARALYRHRNPERYRASQARIRARRRITSANAKVAEFAAKIEAAEAEERRLLAIIAKGDCRGELRADGTPYVFFWTVQEDLERHRYMRLHKWRKALDHWKEIATGT